VRASPSAFRLLAAYLALTVLLNVVVLLPGDELSFSSTWGLLVSLAVQGLLVWRLTHGSVIAWLVALFFALGGVASAFLTAAPLDVSVAFFVLVCLAQAVVLVLLWVGGFLRSGRPAPPAAA
jgi:hypothetical protein